MTSQAGLWIDHRQAVIVLLEDKSETIKRIESDMEKHVRYSGASDTQAADGHNDAAEDIRDRRFDNHLNTYYDEVIAALHEVESILIMGPGEAKGELQKRLEGHEASRHVVAVETADKMTDGQIVAQVKHHFHV
ncbi:MAG: hypothetical protein ABI947_30230 [Chloroflexota bacterium]